MSEKVRIHLFVSGRVQGISFRWRTRHKAQQIKVLGWVKNLPDGRVEMILEGERERIEELIEWVRKEPFLVKVDNLEKKWEEYQGEFSDFEIRT